MTFRAGLRAAIVAAAATVLAGCAHLPFGSATAPDAAASAAAAARPQYRLEVNAPDPLRAMLLDYLDLSRFQNAPASAGIDASEIDRLLRAAPAQARGLLETQGYFNARVEARRAGADDATGLPVLRIEVVPGPQTLIGEFHVDATGPLQDAAAAGDPAAVAELSTLRSQWPLRSGEPFREASWSAAKNLTIARLRADGYAAATWGTTRASVDAPANRADVAVVIDSGPLYRMGALRIEGAERYDTETIRRLATFAPGDAYSEKSLLDFQERLQKVGLFGGASVELDPDPAHSGAATVVVHVKELNRHQATVGLGYSSNTGPRLSLEHTDRRFFGQPWIEKDKFTYGPLNQSAAAELSSYPLEDLWRNLVSGSTSKLLVDQQQVIGWNARIGRAQETPRIDRTYFAELTHARLDSDTLTRQADASSLAYQWVFRHVDDLLLPTRGYALSAQLAGGYARGNQSVLGAPLEVAKGPFARLYSRLSWYQPFGTDWFGTARLEAGQVLAHSAVGIPDTLLFRAGGADSVRGYGYRTLGPEIQGVTISGRALLTGSLEVAHPISPRYPAFLWATFIDAGNAADTWQALHPDFGYGVGARWRSPVGPVSVDLAYGQQVRRLRLHLSVGATF